MPFRNVIALCLILSLFAQAAFSSGAYSFADLDQIDEASLKDELNRLCQRTFQSEIGKIRLEENVRSKWLELGLDETVDRVVDEAISAVRRKTSYLDLLWSGWSEEAAKELANTTTRRAFDSVAFRSAIEELAAAVADGIAEEFDDASQEAATSGLLAVEEFLGYHYSAALKPVFFEELSKVAREAGGPETRDLDVIDGSPISRHSSLFTGVAVIVGTQIATMIGQQIVRALGKRIAGKVATRIAGRIAAGLIPVAGWIVGGLMIIWDLIQGADGALPEIRKGLKDPHVKGLIQEGLADEISAQLSSEAPAIARRISLEVFSRWADFKEKFALVLDLTHENAAFKQLVDGSSKEDLYKLSELVTVTLGAIGKNAVIEAVERGQIARAMDLPESTFDIIETAGSLETLLDWAKVAGSSIESVARFEIYKHKSPGDFDRGRLGKLLAVGDEEAISKLVLLDNDRLASVLRISSFHLAGLGRTLGASDLGQLAWYVEQGDDGMLNTLTLGLMEDPALRDRLADETFKDLLVGSSDRPAFLAFLESPASYPDMFLQAGTLWRGDVSAAAFFYKYRAATISWFVVSLALIALALAAAAFLLLRKVGAMFRLRRRVTRAR